MKPSIPSQYPSDNDAPDAIHGYISVEGAKSVFTERSKKFPDSPKAYHAKKADRDRVRHDLQKSGFVILAESPLGLSVVAAPGAFEELTGGKLEMVERLCYADAGCMRYVTNIDVVGKGQPLTLGVARAASKSAKIDGILVERPKMLHAMFPSPMPPTVSKFHLTLPGDVAANLGAAPAHQQEFRGDGVSVAMVDTGQYRHPFFTAHGYHVKRAITMVPGTSRSKDPVGHGTGESANIFATAPGAVLQPIRASNDGGDLVAALTGFLKAKELLPKVITCSWGGEGDFPPAGPPNEDDQAIALELMDAVAQGICVIFSAGNGHFSVEPQVPGVIAAGGAFVSQGLDLRASDYASGYDSPWFGGTRVPTVCGLVGLLPRAQYLMLPVQPGCQLDRDESLNEPDEVGDGTTTNDGWAMFSGTSGAAPQVAGVAALILGAKPGLTPAQVAEAMKRTAIDVMAGRCHPRFANAATVGPDAATGFGLVNAAAAVAFARSQF